MAATEDQTSTATVDELRGVLAYVRAFKPATDPPAILERTNTHLRISVDVHRVDRAVLRELVADNPDAWDVDVVDAGLHERYFRARLQDAADCAMCVYTEHEHVEEAL